MFQGICVLLQQAHPWSREGYDLEEKNSKRQSSGSSCGPRLMDGLTARFY